MFNVNTVLRIVNTQTSLHHISGQNLSKQQTHILFKQGGLDATLRVDDIMI